MFVLGKMWRVVPKRLSHTHLPNVNHWGLHRPSLCVPEWVCVCVHASPPPQGPPKWMGIMINYGWALLYHSICVWVRVSPNWIIEGGNHGKITTIIPNEYEWGFPCTTNVITTINNISDASHSEGVAKSGSLLKHFHTTNWKGKAMSFIHIDVLETLASLIDEERKKVHLTGHQSKATAHFGWQLCAAVTIEKPIKRWLAKRTACG